MITSYFSNIRAQIREEIKNANNEILIAVYWFTNQDIFDDLIKKLLSGIKIKLIIHNDFINNREGGLDFQNFINNGGEFYFSTNENPMHNKFCVLDNRTLINGSYNWTYFAEQKNRENILIIKEEPHVITSFINEFNRLISLSNKIDEIELISKFEIGLNDNLNQKTYLAEDILFKAKNDMNMSLVDKAFDIQPNDIKIQKLANELNLLPKYKLKYNIGVSIINDEIKLLAKKREEIPSSFQTILRTSFDNQIKSNTKIVYGISNSAKYNSVLCEILFDKIPPMPKGKAEFKFIFSIDKDGNAIIEQLCLANGIKLLKRVKNINLIEKKI